MKYRKISSLTLIKHLCHTSVTETAPMQRKDPLTFLWLESEKKNKSQEISELLCPDHFFPCSLSIKDRPVVAFQKLQHARSINEAMIPKQFNTYRKWCFRMSKKRKKN